MNIIIKYVNQEYYCENNQNIILSDEYYDILRNYILSKYPENKYALNQHSECILSEKEKVKLPYEMWSMNKLKPNTNEISNWKSKYDGPYIVSCKLDGISALYVYENGIESMYTRGNGTHGQNISSLIPYIIWKKKDKNTLDLNSLLLFKKIVIRGEIIIKKSLFEKKYKDEFSNSRNFVAGMINKKKIEPNILIDIDFVVYELIYPSLKPSEQFEFLNINWVLKINNNLNQLYVVDYIIISNNKELTNENLSNKLDYWRNNYDYLIDGIVITNDNVYERTSKNPDHAFAFKMLLTNEYAEGTVVNVIWTPSKDGYLKPVVEIEPIKLDGVIIKKITGNNAKFIKDNKIGVGSKVKVIRSGNVIPKIDKVLIPSKFHYYIKIRIPKLYMEFYTSRYLYSKR